MRQHFIETLACLTSAVIATPLLAEPKTEPTAEGIQDNSFLVEEAYNQEAGVVQHIFNAQWSVDRHSGSEDRMWNFAFTQEWPLFGQTHQLSYTVPYSFVNAGGSKVDG